MYMLTLAPCISFLITFQTLPAPPSLPDESVCSSCDTSILRAASAEQFEGTACRRFWRSLVSSKAYSHSPLLLSQTCGQRQQLDAQNMRHKAVNRVKRRAAAARSVSIHRHHQRVDEAREEQSQVAGMQEYTLVPQQLQSTMPQVS